MSKVRSNMVKLLNRPMLVLVPVMFAMLLPVILAGCGSTKVYTAQKSVVYNGALYNASNVKVMSSSIEARLADGTVLDLTNAGRKQFNDFVGNHGPLPVRMVISMDDQQLVYYSRTTGKFSDFDKARKNFTSAKKSIGKFMADKKKTQLKLK